jgi:ketosteroid isomerase-like protein
LAATYREEGAIMTLSVVDRLDILELVAKADSAASQADADLYVSYFTDDAVLDGDMGVHRGKEAIRQSVGPIWRSEGASSIHLTLNAVVKPVADDSDRAVATSTMVVLKNDSVISIHSAAFVVQNFIRVDGVWLIEHRLVRLPGQKPT